MDHNQNIFSGQPPLKGDPAYYMDRSSEYPVNEPEMHHGQTHNFQMSDATGLLSVYPFASATPTSHVARHLNDFSINSQTSSYYHSLNTNRRGEHLAPLLSNGYQNSMNWQTQGNNAIQLLREQQRVDYGVQIPQYPMPNWQSATPQNYESHHTPAFAHELLMQQHQQQYSIDYLPLAHPSSSSLAHALDRRISTTNSSQTNGPSSLNPQVPTPKTTPTKHEESQYFDSFLEKTYDEVSATSHRSSMGPPSSTVSASPEAEKSIRNDQKHQSSQSDFVTPKKQRISSSPDPLLGSPVSPLKRKATSQLQSPMLKRQTSSTLSSLTPLSSPASVATSSTIKQPESPSKRRLTPFIVMPSRVSPHIPVPRVSDLMRMMSDDDLGGYGTPSSSPSKSKGAKDSGVRYSTGLRDDRQP